MSGRSRTHEPIDLGSAPAIPTERRRELARLGLAPRGGGLACARCGEVIVAAPRVDGRPGPIGVALRDVKAQHACKGSSTR